MVSGPRTDHVVDVLGEERGQLPLLVAEEAQDGAPVALEVTIADQPAEHAPFRTCSLGAEAALAIHEVEALTAFELIGALPATSGHDLMVRGQSELVALLRQQPIHGLRARLEDVGDDRAVAHAESRIERDLDGLPTGCEHVGADESFGRVDQRVSGDTWVCRLDQGDLGRVAMYVAKQARAGVVRYDPASDRNDAGKLVLMTELRVAVERGELEVHYQPIVNTKDGTLAKVEALVRWRHPTRGMIGPGVFVPLAAHTRLIVDLNSFVLRESLRQCAIWRGWGIDLEVSVNVTVLELLEASFPTNVDAALRAASFPASALTVELTEEALVQEPERVRRTIDALQGLGVQVAIDDFGTGYSSLSYLKELPVDLLKIDRSFVADLPESHASLAIVAAAIELSHRLGLEVVAEGVETQEQYDCLVELGCDLIQGYLICRPVSAAKLSKMIEAQTAAALDKAA